MFERTADFQEQPDGEIIHYCQHTYRMFCTWEDKLRGTACCADVSIRTYHPKTITEEEFIEELKENGWSQVEGKWQCGGHADD